MKKTKTLILFVDAFSFSDLNEKTTPFMYELAKNGAYGPLKTIPAGYHIEYSMLSGCLPLKHNVWSWYYINKKGSFSKIAYIKPLLKIIKNERYKRKILDIYVNLIRLLQGKTRFLKTNKIPISLLEKFEISVDKMHFEHNPLQVPTLFDILRKHKIKYIGMEFPVISDYRKTGFYFTKGDFKELKKAERLLKKYSIVYLHVWGLDSIEHAHGLHSKEAFEYLKNMDKAIKNIYLRNESLRIIIFSDHGGCNVTKTKNIIPLLKNYNCEYFIGSTTAQIWLKNLDNEMAKEKLKKELKKQGYLIYDENNIEKELFIPYKREFVGDMLVWVRPGEQLYPDFFRDTAKVKSMHGYSIKVPELDGVFIINGFEIKKQIKDMKLYDIAPTILKAMNIAIPKIWDGKARV